MMTLYMQWRNDIIHGVEDFLDSQEKDIFESGIEALKHRWQKSIDNEGDCAEN